MSSRVCSKNGMRVISMNTLSRVLTGTRCIPPSLPREIVRGLLLFDFVKYSDFEVL